MLISFKVKNFKSFLEETELSMKAVPWKASLEYSTVENKDAERTLCSSVIYGVNGSGKSNLLNALVFLCKVIMDGINSYKIYYSNFNATDGTPTVFSVKFINKGCTIDYMIEMMLPFNPNIREQKISYERLIVDNEIIFERNHDSVKTKDHDYPYIDNKHSFMNLDNNLLSPEIKDIAVKWFYKGFYPIYDLMPAQLDAKLAFMYRCGINLTKILDFIGNNGISIGESTDFSGPICTATKDSTTTRLSSLVSPGVMKAIFLISTALIAMQYGYTIFIDQMDDIDVHLVLQLITLFHNDDINVNHAQLIFTTHNPIYINSGIFRPDEIKFVERRGSKSSIYSLADFEDGRDLNYDYIKYVDEGRYGAVNFYGGLAEFFEEKLGIKEEE